MARWQDIVDEVPAFASSVQSIFDAHLHKTLATLRRDGSPRISGTEMRFLDGDLFIGMMLRSMKAFDLLRDPRLAVHSAPVDAEMLRGDAKLAGRAEEVPDGPVKDQYLAVQGDPGEPFHLFRIDLNEVVLTRVSETRTSLVIESWHPGRGLEQNVRS